MDQQRYDRSFKVAKVQAVVNFGLMPNPTLLMSKFDVTRFGTESLQHAAVQRASRDQREAIRRWKQG
ncbi:hypothetical protein ColLi_03027 [Colletotrichum liriopes]|uniref:Uncharacterized protein n=1 Tax=Colletotrichum liriopes TaxID=708192 RepID=A0AA37GFV9_9PEZI|nr:hypothetical protein ColLi_03027 [Colletotrichum liriopes]